MRVEKEGQDEAILFESLYLANLLILPVIAFLVLLMMFVKKHNQIPALAEAHLEQTVSAGMWITVLFVIAGATVLMLSQQGVEDATIWAITIIVFTMTHASMVIIGIIGLAKAMSGKCWRFPVVGRKLPAGCAK